MPGAGRPIPVRARTPAVALALAASVAAGTLVVLLAAPSSSGPTTVTTIASVLAGNVGVGTEVTLENARVVSLTNSSTCTMCATWEKVTTVRLKALSDGSEMDAVLKKVGGNLLQYKKQNGVPTPGMIVRFSGPVAHPGSAWTIDPAKEWVEFAHAGPTVTTASVASGARPVGSYVWIEDVTVIQTFHSTDGDYHVEVRAADGTELTTEITPPHQDELPTPAVGAVLDVFGMVLYDADHAHWEIHPIRCTSRTRCAGAGAGGGAGAPSAPESAAANPRDGEVRVSWKAPAAIGGSAVSSYRVYRAEGSAPLAFLAEAATRYHFDLTAQNGVRYRYAVAAVNAQGEGPRSPEVTAVPGPDGATEWVFDEFENELDLWDATAVAGGSAWTRTQAQAAQGAASATCGDGESYRPGSECALATRAMDFRRATRATLAFSELSDLAGVANAPAVARGLGLGALAGAAASVAPDVAAGDAGRVDASEDAGATWALAHRAPAPTSSGWREASVDLAPLFGAGDARVRLRFTSDAAAEREGWFVDALHIAGARRASAAPGALAASRGDAGVTLAWSAPADAWPGTTYRVLRGASAGSLAFYAEAGADETFLDASPSAEARWYSVTAVDGLESAASAAVEAPLGGAPGPTLFADDFESGTDGWTIVRNGPTGTSTWKVVTTQAKSPTHSVTCGGGTSYAGGSDCEIVSPPVARSGASAPTLRFEHRVGGEAGRDEGRVYARADGGAWTLLGGPYSNVATWSTVALPLPAGATSVEVKFRFTSDANGTQGTAWFVDDVRVTDG